MNKYPAAVYEGILSAVVEAYGAEGGLDDAAFKAKYPRLAYALDVAFHVAEIEAKAAGS
jgi:hypothetical protein